MFVRVDCFVSCNSSLFLILPHVRSTAYVYKFYVQVHLSTQNFNNRITCDSLELQFLTSEARKIPISQQLELFTKIFILNTSFH